MLQYIGIFGMLLLVIAWIPETVEMIKSKKAHLNRKFILLYVFGSGSLIIYSYFIKDFVFLTLNSFITLMALLNGYYEIRKIRK
ncbi:MAG: hypothetical protein AABW72_02965 [archaeon]